MSTIGPRTWGIWSPWQGEWAEDRTTSTPQILAFGHPGIAQAFLRQIFPGCSTLPKPGDHEVREIDPQGWPVDRDKPPACGEREDEESAED